jgi:predicted dehydrogenase
MTIRIAIIGHRHGHITGLIKHAQQRPDMQLVAICEDDPEARNQAVAANYGVPVVASRAELLERFPCDAIGIGDTYGRRGAIAIEALKRGQHVISDKPLCTSLRELDEIERLARAKGLCVGCQLDLRDSGLFAAVRRLVRGGEIGDVHAVSFNGQHPLMYGTRAAWYFEPGQHGGTINDIAIHGLDIVPWVTGLRFTVVNAARNWNAVLPQVPHFRDAGQMMLTMENGCGVLADVSYLVPDSFRYTLPQYWRFLFWGSTGMLEVTPKANAIVASINGETEPRTIGPDAAPAAGYLESFVRDIRGERAGLEFTTEAVIRSSRVTLMAQDAADRNLSNVPVPIR